MSFFANQDRARRRTGILVLLFVMAVLTIVLAVTGLVYGLISSQAATPPFLQWLSSPPGLITGAAVLGVIVAGSLVRYLSLRGGGDAVARMAGARPIAPDTQDPDERRLRHVTEEMAIASGVTMPQLYVMDQETGINAFVAGYQPNEAVLVVTRGTLAELNRDELQGVVGHEFSHILNGDMRLNVRLIALLSGILLIGQSGRVLLRGSLYRSMGRVSSRRNNRGGMLALGLALMAVGYIGLFFGRLIKSAISRQREFLADAASVQFTRQPQGIAGALYKIRLNQQGSQLGDTRHAEDLNHLCFGESIPLSFSRFMASHPAIETRIEAIDPSLLALMRARYGRVTHHRARQKPEARTPQGASALAGQAPERASQAPEDGFSPRDFLASTGTASPDRTQAVTAPLSSQAGQVSEASEDYARQLLDTLPAPFYEHIHSPTGAVHLCYALALIRHTGPDREKGRATLTPLPGLTQEPPLLDSLLQTLEVLDEAVQLPCLELALPALRTLTSVQRQALIRQVKTIAALDRRTSLYEFALRGFLHKHLAVDAGKATPVRFRRYTPVMADLSRLFWLMARATTAGDPGRDSRVPLPEAEVTARYQRAMAGFTRRPGPPPEQTISGTVLARSLQRLAGLSPLLKPAVIDACGDCALSNGHISLREYELLRIVADQLDCPMPPLTGFHRS